MKTIDEIDREIERLRSELETVEGTPTEVYTRIVGYYRSVKAWNRGKREEFRERTPFAADAEAPERDLPPLSELSVLLFTRSGCPGCPPVREHLLRQGIVSREVDVDRDEGLAEARDRNVLSTPTVLFQDADGDTLMRARSLDELQACLNELPSPAGIPVRNA